MGTFPFVPFGTIGDTSLEKWKNNGRGILKNIKIPFLFLKNCI